MPELMRQMLQFLLDGKSYAKQRENDMSTQVPTSDSGLLDLLRITGPLGVLELADAMEVTPTAVRQRLTRLLGQDAIQRETVRNGRRRGRPKHRYWLTEKGLRLTGSNFTDLAVTLWQEVCHVADEKVRRETLRRIARALASGYANQIQGNTPAERMQSLAALLGQRQIPATVEDCGEGAVLTARACPYPKLAEQDQGVCSMEQMMFSELLGQDVTLTQCRLQGGSEGRFQAN
jgi:DeoR family transcriptional regulator, suf operon transcriptional repressor